MSNNSFDKVNIAIVIPYYNASQLVAKVIEQIPSYINSVIIVNDKSPDELPKNKILQVINKNTESKIGQTPVPIESSFENKEKQIETKSNESEGNVTSPTEKRTEPEKVISSFPKSGKKKLVLSGGISMKATLQKQQEEREEEERYEKDPFTLEQLLVKWNDYAKEQDSKNRKTLFTAMTKTEPKLNGWEIQHTLENITLFNSFNGEKQEFLDYLKKELNNYSISLQSELVRNEEAEVFLYTDKEKFKKFAEDHPELLYLKEKLHLDFEF